MAFAYRYFFVDCIRPNPIKSNQTQSDAINPAPSPAPSADSKLAAHDLETCPFAEEGKIQNPIKETAPATPARLTASSSH